MNIIFFGNSDYITNSNNLNRIIENINQKNEYNIVIYGGNYLSKSNEDDMKKKESNKSQNNITSFLQIINKLSANKNNLVLFGNYDLSNTTIFQTEIDFYKKSNNKFKIFNNVTKDFIIGNSVIVVFDSNLLLFPNLNELVVNTIYQNLFDEFSKNENKNKDKTIGDLIDYQFESILGVIKKNSNKKNIIFITQNALINGGQNTNTNEPNELTLFFKWVSDFYLFMNSYNISWLCSNPCVFESGTININNESGNILNITQYIIGTGGNEQINLNNTNKNYSKSLSVESEYTNLTEKLNISYNITKSINAFGYLTFQEDLVKFNFINIDEQDKNLDENLSDTEINFNFDEKKDNNKINKLSKNSKYSKEYKKIFKNIEITEISDDLNNSFRTKEIETETEANDPYKFRYLKYKAKLFELRKNKNKN